MVTTRTLGADLAPLALADTWWQLLGAQDIVSGESVDWNDLMRRHGRRVVVALLARGVAIDRANDLAQDAWMRIIAQHERGRLPIMRLPGLVVAQAMYLARDDKRRRDRRDRLQVHALPGDPAVGPEPFERRIAARQDLRRVLEVVEKTYPNARNVFALAYGPRALGAAEIADELGLSCQRVRQIVCELRKRFRDSLQGDGGGDAR